MINDVRKLADGKYIINDSVVVRDITAEEDGFHYSLDYDDKLVTSDEANELGQEFFKEAFQNVEE